MTPRSTGWRRSQPSPALVTPGSGAVSPAAGLARGPDPVRERHRATQPAPEDARPERLWLAIVAFAEDRLVWVGHVGLATSPVRRWEPKRLRLRPFNASAVLTRHVRQVLLHIKETCPWTHLALAAQQRLRSLTTAPT